jgi:alpha-tubulin suppressor-like RCC1 family protein
LSGVPAIGAGDSFTCALLAVGQVRCWGYNGGGRLGDGTLTERPLPVVVRGTSGAGPLSGVSQLSVGRAHVCATLDSGQARCWGVGEHGRIGDGTQADRKHAVVVKDVDGRGPLTGVRQVVAGSTHTCARLASRQVRCWGTNFNHQLGIPTPAVQRLLPVVVRQRTGSHPPLGGVIALGSGGDTTCAVLSTHQVRCWGDDQQGELGNGTTTGQIGPVAVRSPAGGIDPPTPGNLTGITQVSGGLDHLCARRNNGRAYCWGSNTYDQIGSGSGNDPTHRPDSVLEAT